MRRLCWILALALSYFTVSSLSYQLQIAGGVTPIWPPAGLALATLVLFGRGLWPGIALGQLCFQLWAGDYFSNALLVTLGNTLESIVAASLLCWKGFDPSFGRLKDCRNFVFLACLIGTIPSATLGTLSLLLKGKIYLTDFRHTWGTWWISDVFGVLIVAPFIMTWWSGGKPNWRSAISNVLELVCVDGLILFAGLFFFDLSLGFQKSSVPTLCLVFPSIIWAAFRFGVRSAVTTTFLATIFAVTPTVLGAGPLSTLDEWERLMILEFAMGTVSITALILASLIAERTKSEWLVKERTRALRQSESQLKLITDALPSSVAYFDTELRYQFVNSTYMKWRLKSVCEVLGKKLEEVLDEEDYREVLPWAEKTLRGQTSTYEMRLRYWNQTRDVLVQNIPDIGEDGRAKGFISVVTDISEQKKAEINLRKAIESADAANAAKSAFLANMSHEIRTPLGSVIGFSELVANQQVPEEERDYYVAAVKRNGELLSNIINDILDLSKVEAGKFELEKMETPLSEVLSDVTSMLQLQAQEKGLALSVHIDESAPRIIETDPLRFRQILLNVVGNAIKFTQRGSVDVSISQSQTSLRRRILKCDIKDTGPGLAVEQATKLFQPFVQADISTKRTFGGTGLGLALSKRLANLLGGDVVLSETAPGKGSTFTITIDAGNRSEGVPTWHPFHKPSFELDARLDGIRVLLVEDTPDNQMLVGCYLDLAGAKVSVADHGKEALARVESEDFDVLLMDLQMPIMDGYETTAALRKSGYKKPIIALTAHAMKEERIRCLASGFDDHIMKPVDRGILLKTIAGLHRDGRC